MKIDVRPRKRNAGRPAEKSAPRFLQWLRGRACIFAGVGACEGKIEAAHVDYAGDKGMGTKVSDRFAVPMCRRHHARQHAIGWRYFQTEMSKPWTYALEAAEAYWRAWPGRIAWERKNTREPGLANNRPGQLHGR
jgi:hypothetical protein